MKNKIFIFFEVILVFVLGIQAFSCQAENQTVEYQTITPTQAKAILDSGRKYLLLDVRTEEEYVGKHIPYSMLLPLDKLEQEAPAQLTDKTIPIIVYCQIGKRSRIASEILIKLGYQHVYYLGGIIDWPFETVSGNNDKP